MVAFELAQFYEKAGTTPEAVRWFTTAAERFRRPQWKQKAEEGLTRLGAPIPVTPAVVSGMSVSETTAEPVTHMEPIIAEFSEEQQDETEQEMTEGTQETVFEHPQAGGATTTPATAQPSETGPDRRRRRRGRRGGRGRHKGVRPAGQLSPAAASTVAPVAPPAPPSMFDRVADQRTHPGSLVLLRPRSSRNPARASRKPPAHTRLLPPLTRRVFVPVIPRFPRA